MGSPSTRPQVMAYFTERPHKACYVEAIAKATKLTVRQVQGAITNIRTAHSRGEIDFQIDVVQRGQIWMHTPTGEVAVAPRISETAHEDATDSSNMFELVGSTKDGDHVVRDRGGALYKATLL